MKTKKQENDSHYVIFRQQIKDDIEVLKEKISWVKNIQKEEYAFNYWVLENIYTEVIETCQDNITEYNDKGIDCWVYHKDEKQLYIIQNKYYQENTSLDTRYLSDFLMRPIGSLLEGKYKNKSLQEIFNNIKKDPEHTINLHFFFDTRKRQKRL